MPNWHEFQRTAPDLAAAGARLFAREGIGWLATLRKDGAPRLHAIVPLFAAGEVGVFIPAHSPKRLDLQRDPRYVLHAPLGPHDEEFSIDGTARRIDDDGTRTALAAVAGHVIRDTDVLFVFDISRCLWAIWEHTGTPDIRVQRRRWDAHS